ncbi:NlpC/P60 family protein [Streptomyces sp. NPDC053755]|uniref:C40 family peptidase n=1 Tax=Streptomyces sp. NPDC053755 TaxID=3155815 RepID=UPI0034296DBA
MSLSRSTPSRRSALAVLTGAAVGASLPLAPSAFASPAMTPAVTPTAAVTGETTAVTAGDVPGAARGRLPMVADPCDPWHFATHPAGALTTRTIAGTPPLLEVSDDRGVLATLTTGAATVTLRGPRRWFTEQRKPFADDFARVLPAGRTGWGPSPGGGTWSTYNGPDTNYFLESGRAVILLDRAEAGSSRHALLPDKTVGDLDAAARFSFDKVPAGAPASLALTFAVTDVSNHYRARLIVTPAGEVQLVLEKALNNDVTTLGPAVTVGTGFAAYDHWWVRVEKTGPLLCARAWRNGTAEPEDTWHHSVRDPEKDPAKVFGTGTCGVRAHASAGSTTTLEARVYDFVVGAADWADPPVVCHDTWVRLLPAPFDGTWTPALEQRIRAWAGDTSPDALAYASMYRPYAPVVTDPALQGAQVLGQSRYSKPDGAGVRPVGADFHEYMGRDWTFPASGESAVANSEFAGCLDCSGFVRMVYGHHLGIPMVAFENFDGRNLPRTSKDQSAHGPGVVVAKGTTAAPSLAALRIGDVVFFDATLSDPADPETVEGVIDHTGIYLGQDQHGGLRFVSSRKTPDGPTMGDLGGKSILNGRKTEDGRKGDLYTDSLRVVRRF